MFHNYFDLVTFAESPLTDFIYEPMSATTDWIQDLQEWQLIDQRQQHALQERLSGMQLGYEVVSGGQLSNTLYNLACLSQQTLALGMVTTIGKDHLGLRYASELLNQRISLQYSHFDNQSTGVCLSLQLDNASKIMLTRLATMPNFSHLDEHDLRELLAHTRYVLIEGYLWNKEADWINYLLSLVRDMRQTERIQLRIGTTLSAPFIAQRLNLDDVLQCFDLIAGNEEEFAALAQQTITEEELHRLARPEQTIVYTKGKRGAAIIHQKDLLRVSPQPIPPHEVVDVTGAGDGFLSGVLYALLNEQSIESLGVRGVEVAQKIIRTKGARL